MVVIMYATWIAKGKREFSDVPELLKDQVKEILLVDMGLPESILEK